MDIGGTKCAINLARVGSSIEMLDRVSFDTKADMGFENVRDRLFNQAHRLLERNEIGLRMEIPEKPLHAIGVSCGGPLDCRQGLILSPPHLPGWDNIPFAQMLTREFSVPAFVQNDANACALVEWKLGAGRGTRNMVFLTMGTGFGAGIIAENRLIEGARGFAGEVGHVRLEKDGPLLFGKTGTAEGFCSGAGIAEIAKAYARQKDLEGSPPVWVREGKDAEGLTAKTIASYAEGGDPDALEVYRQAGDKLGQALAILVDLLNPERIVIGSVFARAQRLLREAMEHTLRKEALSASFEDCRVVPAETGERIGDYASILAACYAMGMNISGTPNTACPAALTHYARLFERYPVLQPNKEGLLSAFMMLRGAYTNGKKLLVCGNGGSAADAEHIVGELMKGFLLPRHHGRQDLHPRLQQALPAIALTGHMALSTAFANDVDAALIFAQQVYGLGQAGDTLLCISTSGNAANCVEAAKAAHALGLNVIALTGRTGGLLATHCDVLLNMDADYTPDVQELHLPVYHTLCAMLEAEFF